LEDLEILYFELLKLQIQAQYLKHHTPSFDEISKWKGIDIIYFQEDLRKIAKGNISEKSFYTYFKSSPVVKIPRIDMLNLLSVYTGYESWADFRKQNKLPEDDQLKKEFPTKKQTEISTRPEIPYLTYQPEEKTTEKTNKNEPNKDILQKTIPDNQFNNTNTKNFPEAKIKNSKRGILQIIQQYLWLGLTIIFAIGVILLGFKDQIFGKTFVYCFSDADRGSGIQSELEIRVFKQNESPILYKIKSGECFRYPTNDHTLKMEISSPFYENLTVTRNLVNAPKDETIELKPDDYKMAVNYFSMKDISGNPDESLISQKRTELEKRISDDATIIQVYDNDIYGVETLNKEKYITLVTTPTTSLKNLKVIEMKRNDNGKIILIKFKITNK